MTTEGATAEEAMSWVGYKLDALDDAGVARVEGVLVDASSGEPAWLLIRRGRIGRRSAVPFEFVAAGVGRAWLPCPREMIRSAPEVDPAAGLSAAEERALADHYGLGSEAPRRAALAGRPDDERTAVPAAG